MMRESVSGIDQPLVEPLSERELEILRFMAARHSNREIAEELVLSLNTVKWYARQVYGKLGVSDRGQAAARAKELGLLEDGSRSPLPRHNLPAQLTPFVGRGEEVARVCDLLSDASNRLVTLAGPGGMGKTRLAIQAASRLRAESAEGFRDGVYFVPLAAVGDPASIPVAVAQAMGFSFPRGKESPAQKLGQYLRQRRMLLVLDNIEHLIDSQSQDLLTEILTAAPGVSLMVTSRVRLNLRGESLFPLGGLEIPELGAMALWEQPLERAATYSGLQLFLHSAQRVRPDFALNTDNLMPAGRICTLVEGMPLGIELAAAWLAVLEPEEIAGRIEESLSFLRTDAGDVPDRQRSLHAVADSSWALLAKGEQRAVQRLSVFRGGFDRAAAEEGGRASLETLLALANKCWIQRGTGGRFQIHELLRQYGGGKLALDPALEAAARDQHGQYYCAWLDRQGEGIKGAGQPPAWAAIQTDIENIRAGCMRVATQGQPGWLERAVDTLGWFYYLGYGNYQQGEMTFRGLREALVAAGTWLSPATAGRQRTMVRVLLWEATTCSLLGDYPRAEHLLGEGLALLDAPILAGEDTRLERAHIARQLGYKESGDRVARSHFQDSVELYRQIGHKLGMAYALLGLGRAANHLGDLEGAQAAMTQSISLHQDAGNEIGQSEAMSTLGALLARQARFQEAEDLIRQSLSLTPETNRFGIAYGLGALGLVQHLSGRFAEAQASLMDCIAIFEDLGWQVWAIGRSVNLARARLHAGEYGAARIQAEGVVARARQVGWARAVGYGNLVFGEVALAEADHAQARQMLQESLLTLHEMVDEAWDVSPSPWLALAARGLGEGAGAWRHLAVALDWVEKYHGSTELLVALACLALLLADEGKVEDAVEIYALASRHPLVASSRWFKEVAGKQIAAAAAGLPAAVAGAARERGRQRDLEAAVGELREAFPAFAQGKGPDSGPGID